MSKPEWHIAAIKDLEETSMTLEQIAKKHDRSRSAINKILHGYNVIRQLPPMRSGPMSVENSLPISREHVALGVRISLDRGGRPSADYAVVLGVSPYLLAKMEAGQHDFTLTQIQKISVKLGKPLAELIQTFNANLYQGRTNGRN